ncbi:hormogonium polysaccharide secretion pseudopilin HpsC [Tumidithrix elongata]
MQKQLNNFFRRFLNRRYRLRGQVRGFTLLELLIAMVMGVLIVGTLMTFVFSVADTDRQEAAKAASQEEIQAALDYIADDMREAVYIYDANGLNSASAAVPGIRDSLPAFANTPTADSGEPVLVFWKRYVYKSTDTVTTPNGQRLVACLPHAVSTPTANCTASDIFRYSLVAYYIVKSPNNAALARPWSNSARIVRFELKDGISTGTGGRLPCVETVVASCPAVTTVSAIDYYVTPDTAFKLFSLSGSGTVSDQMNAWSAGGAWSAGSGFTLVDFIDDTAYNATPYTPPVIIQDNTIVNANNSSPATATGCNGDNGTGSNITGSQRVPGTFNTTSPAASLTSFYACVNSTNSVARIYIRGNALVRLNDNRAIKFPNANNTPFLPTANIQVYARGVLIPG